MPKRHREPFGVSAHSCQENPTMEVIEQSPSSQPINRVLIYHAYNQYATLLT